MPAWLERGEGYFVSTASAAGMLSQIGDEPPIRGRVSEEPGAYYWRVRFADPGRYKMVLEIVTMAGDKFRVEFPVEVGS